MYVGVNCVCLCACVLSFCIYIHIVCIGEGGTNTCMCVCVWYMHTLGAVHLVFVQVFVSSDAFVCVTHMYISMNMMHIIAKHHVSVPKEFSFPHEPLKV